MKQDLNDYEMKNGFKKIISHVSADYSQRQFETLLIEKSIDQIASSQVKHNWLTSIGHFRFNNQRRKIIFLSEILIAIGLVLYFNSLPLQEDLTAYDLIGEFSLETI